MAEIITSDLCVIGAGLGGLAAAAEARALGASVVLVERGRMGGNYLNAGTVPARALAAAAAHAHAMRTGGPYGIAAETPRVNARRLHDGIGEVIASLAPRDAVARMEALEVQVIQAEAHFIDARTIAAGDVHIRPRHVILATGARAAVPSIPGLDGIPYFTTETIFDNTRRLTHLLVVGAGAAGLEIGQSYRRLGAEVTVVDPDGPLPGLDPDLAEVVLARLREEGLDIRAGARVAEIQPRSQGIGVVVDAGGEAQRLDVSHVLVAEERVPVLDALHLDRAGIRRSRDDARFLQLTPGLRTSNRRVYAIGDAAGGPHRGQLAPWQARAVVRRALLGLPTRLDPDAAPAVWFTDPEVATVGLSEAAARARHGSSYQVSRISLADCDRARATRQAYGVLKAVVGRDGRLLGAGIVGDRAGELIPALALAVARGMKAADLDAMIAPHATLAEALVRLGREYSEKATPGPLAQRLIALRRLLP